MPLKIITAPTAEPITRLEAKYHCRVIADPQDASAHPDDAYFDALIVAARERAEHLTGRALMAQTLELAIDEFPDSIYLPMPPLVTVSTIKYVDTAGDLQTMDSADYLVDSHNEPARVTPAYGVCWPSTREQPNAVLVRYTAGYASALLVPQSIKTWMLINIGTAYENREALVVGTIVASVPYADRLLDSSKVWGA